MIEYCVITNKIKNIYKYPKGIEPYLHCLCLFNDIIYIINGCYGNIISFNPTTKSFKKLTAMKQIGAWACCAVLHDKIHIFHGTDNKDQHLIYSPETNSIQSINDDCVHPNILSGAACVAYNNRLYRLGGYSRTINSRMDWFIMSGKIKKNDQHKNINWVHVTNRKLERPLSSFGRIVHNDLLFIFGGATYLNRIYCLDLSDDNSKWKELDLRCPDSGCYLAVLVTKTEDKVLVDGFIRKCCMELKLKELSMDFVRLINDFCPSFYVHLLTERCKQYSMPLSIILNSWQLIYIEP